MTDQKLLWFLLLIYLIASAFYVLFALSERWKLKQRQKRSAEMREKLEHSRDAVDNRLKISIDYHEVAKQYAKQIIRRDT